MIRNRKLRKLFDPKKTLEIQKAKASNATIFFDAIHYAYKNKHKEIIDHVMNCQKCSRVIEDASEEFMLLLITTKNICHKHYHKITDSKCLI